MRLHEIAVQNSRQGAAQSTQLESPAAQLFVVGPLAVEPLHEPQKHEQLQVLAGPLPPVLRAPPEAVIPPVAVAPTAPPVPPAPVAPPVDDVPPVGFGTLCNVMMRVTSGRSADVWRSVKSVPETQ